MLPFGGILKQKMPPNGGFCWKLYIKESEEKLRIG